MNSYWIGATDHARMREFVPSRPSWLYLIAVGALVALNGYLLGCVIARVI